LSGRGVCEACGIEYSERVRSELWERERDASRLLLGLPERDRERERESNRDLDRDGKPDCDRDLELRLE
jgi:hypothetical protein